MSGCDWLLEFDESLLVFVCVWIIDGYFRHYIISFYKNIFNSLATFFLSLISLPNINYICYHYFVTKFVGKFRRQIFALIFSDGLNNPLQICCYIINQKIICQFCDKIVIPSQIRRYVVTKYFSSLNAIFLVVIHHWFCVSYHIFVAVCYQI